MTLPAPVVRFGRCSDGLNVTNGSNCVVVYIAISAFIGLHPDLYI